eukprot:scaffold17516_cov134-Isochrysis_galbana.AAC.2
MVGVESGGWGVACAARVASSRPSWRAAAMEMGSSVAPSERQGVGSSPWMSMSLTFLTISMGNPRHIEADWLGAGW